MAGGFHSERQRARAQTLAERTGAPPPAPTPTPPSVDLDPKPCWIDSPTPVPGHVVSWHHDPTGQWVAVIVTTVAAAHVQPRP